MKENEDTNNHDRKPQGLASASQPPAKGSARESLQPKGGERKKRKSDRLSHAAGQRK